MKDLSSNPHLQIRILTNPEVLDSQIRIRKSKTLKIRIVDSIRRSVFERFVSWIRCENKNLKLLDSFRFVRIRIRIHTNPTSL